MVRFYAVATNTFAVVVIVVFTTVRAVGVCELDRAFHCHMTRFTTVFTDPPKITFTVNC